MHNFKSLMIEFIATHKTLLIGYIVVLIILPLQDIGVPHVIGKLLKSLREENFEYKYMYILLGMIVIIQFGHFINDIIEIKIFPMFQKFISKKILTYIFDRSSTNLQEILNGKVLSILSHAPRTMYNYIDIFRTELIPQILVFLIAIIYIGKFNMYLALVVIFIITAYYIVSFLTINSCREGARQRESYLIQVNEQVDDVLMNVVGILNAGETDKELSILDKYYDMYQKYGEKTMSCTMKYKFILTPLALLSLVTFIYVGYDAVRTKKLNIDNYIVCIMIFLYVFNSIIKTTGDVRDTSIRGGMVEEHLKIFDSMHESIENRSTALNVYSNKYIYFDNINFSYNNKPILKDFTLEIKKGEKLLIIGHIGSGKTTILKLLMRYNNPESGHVYYNGIPFENISRKDIRKKIGYIPQNPILLNRTLYENIIYGTKGYTKAHIMALIRNLKLEHVFNESKLDQYVGKHGSKLSGGQRQVVWILRVLIQNPEILIMDEPTSAIDKDTKTFIDRLFDLVMKNRTVIIVSHDEYMSSIVDRTIKMPILTSS